MKTMHVIRAARGGMLAALTLAALAGCSSPVLRSTPLATQAEGLAYALPKGQIQVTAQRKLVDAKEVEAARKAADDAKAAADAAKVKFDGLEAETGVIDARATAAAERAKKPDATEADRAAAADLHKQLAIAKIVLDLQRAEVKKRTKARDDAVDAARLLVGNVGQWVETVNLTVQANVPDPSQRYLIQHDPSWARDDKFKLEVAGGLLSTSNSESTGQAATVVLNLVRSISGLAADRSVSSRALLWRVPHKAAPPAQEPRCTAYSLVRTFDPTDRGDVDRVRAALKVRGLNLDVQPEPPPAGKPEPVTRAGLLYRALVPVAVTVDPIAGDSVRAVCGDAPAVSTTQVSAILPDQATVLSLPVLGVAFAKTTVKYGFKDGIPTLAEIDRPSQAAAIASLPIDILKAIVSVPAELIRLRVDYSTQSKGLIDAQANELKALKDLLAAQKALDDARAAAGEPD